ncbi:hypothetical protein [Microbispora sp. NPDC049125]|uniref:hypothetical protein n=1 Tax=Microbispora sp. NPDC049125 TaxID=3154929 RepID=UPI0034675B9B
MEAARERDEAAEPRVFRVTDCRWTGPVPGEGDGAVFWVSLEPRFPVHAQREMELASWHIGYFTSTAVHSVPASDEEARRWSAAAGSYLDEIRAAGDELHEARRRVRRWRPAARLPLVRHGVAAKAREAEERYVRRIRAAADDYRWCSAEIERRLAEVETRRREEARRNQERYEAARRRTQAKVDAWEWTRAANAAAADMAVWGCEIENGTLRVFLHDRRPDPEPAQPDHEPPQPEHGRGPAGSGRPLNAREVVRLLVVSSARRGVTRQEWDRAARRAVEASIEASLKASIEESVEESAEGAAEGSRKASAEASAEARVEAADFRSWWAGVISREINKQALDAAVREVAATVDHVARLLDTSGRPGIAAITEKNVHESVEGWRAVFDWSFMTAAPPSVTPPPFPVDTTGGGRWWHGAYDEFTLRAVWDDVVLLGGRSRGERRAIAETAPWGISDYTRHQRRWDYMSASDFARQVFRDRVSYLEPYGYAKPFGFALADHADARQFVPYVRQVAHGLVTGFRAVAEAQGLHP